MALPRRGSDGRGVPRSDCGRERPHSAVRAVGGPGAWERNDPKISARDHAFYYLGSRSLIIFCQFSICFQMKIFSGTDLRQLSDP